jgi:hypothetical protein
MAKDEIQKEEIMSSPIQRSAPAFLAAAVLALAALASPLRAQQAFNTTIYFDYAYFLTNDGPVTANPLDNKFSFRRAYFTYENRWGDLRFRFRYDADNTANITALDLAKASTKKDDKFRPFIKHLYMQYDNFLIPDLSLKVGMTETITFKTAEERWGLRSVAKTLLDGYKDVTGVEIDATSADMGFSLTGALTKYFRYGFMLTNGSHYSHAENDKFKKIMVQGTIVPLAGFSLVGYMDYEKQSDSAEAKTYKLDAYFEMVRDLTVAFEWFTYNNDTYIAGGKHYDVGGWSLFGRTTVKKDKLFLFARYDQYEPNTQVGNDKINLIIAGLEWQPLANTALKLQPNVWFYTYQDSAKKNDIVAVMTFFWSF